MDVRACPRCGGRLPLITMVTDPLVGEWIHPHLARVPASAPFAPAPLAGPRRLLLIRETT